MSSSRSRRLRENRRYHRTQVTITIGSNLRFRNNGGRQDFILRPYQIRRCNTSRERVPTACGRVRTDFRGNNLFRNRGSELEGAGSSPYLNNIVEQDHRFIKKRITASLGFRSVEGACRTIAGYEAMHAIRKGQVRWVAKGDAVAQRQFIHTSSASPHSSRRARMPSPLHARCLQQNLYFFSLARAAVNLNIAGSACPGGRTGHQQRQQHAAFEGDIQCYIVRLS